MKTNPLKFSVLNDNTQGSETHDNMVARKPLQTLQNNLKKHSLSGKKQTSKDIAVKNTKQQDDTINKELKKNEETQTLNETPIMVDKEIQLTLNQVTVADLTSEDSPSETYWQLLAEKRRVALEKTLAENKNLHLQIELLERKCQLKDEMLEEARAMADVLQELLNEN